MRKKCTICQKSGIDRVAVGLGLCWMHYGRNRKHGDPHTVLTRRGREPKLCTNGCSSKVSSHGLCSKCATKKLYDDRRAIGICYTCGKVPAENQCRACKDAANERRRLRNKKSV